MKKRLTLLISLIMMLGMTAVANASDFSKFDDFENYTGGNPAGWSSSFVDSLSAVQVDQEHGTSMRVKTSGTGGGRPTITIPETVSSGRFLISTEIRMDDNYKNFRMMVHSPTSNSDAHSCFYVGKNGFICSAVSTLNAWSFPQLVEYEYGKWYQIDILIDFDAKNIQYFVDGVLKDKQPCGFVDFDKIIFMTESSTPPSGQTGYIYMDNVSFKYVSAGEISSGLGNALALAGTDTIDVLFSDLVAKSSLRNVKGYDVGANPVSFTSREIAVECIATSAKKATFKFAEPFEKNKIYKLDLTGAKSAFGDEFGNNTIYFASSRETTLQTPVDVSFPSDLATDTTHIISSDTNWVKWSYTGTRSIIARATDAELGNVLKLAPQSAGWGSQPSIEIKRDFGNALINELTMECKMKIVKGNQYFLVYDSNGAALELLTFKDDGIYYGETKIADTTLNQWFVVKASFNQVDGTITFDIDGTQTEPLSYKNAEGENKISDVKVFAIKQLNATNNASGSNRAESYYAYYKVQAQMASVYTKLVSFDEENGKTYYPDDNIPSNLSKINISFTGDVDAGTLSTGVKLKKDNVDVPIDSLNTSYNSATRTYSIVLPDYLYGGTNYVIDITADVKNPAGASIIPTSGTFTTSTGIMRAEDLNIAITGGNVSVGTELIHTNTGNNGKTLYMIYAAYEDDLMVDFKINPVFLNTDVKKKYVLTSNYSLPQNVDDVRVFLWKGIGTTPQEMTPFVPLNTKTIVNS